MINLTEDEYQRAKRDLFEYLDYLSDEDLSADDTLGCELVREDGVYVTVQWEYVENVWSITNIYLSDVELWSEPYGGTS